MARATKRVAQDHIFGLMQKGSFNLFEGANIVRSLKQHKSLWESVVFLKTASCERDLSVPNRCGIRNDLVALQHLNQDHWWGDTLYILAPRKNIPKLKKLAKRWDANSIYTVSDQDCGNRLGDPDKCKKHQLLELWWD